MVLEATKLHRGRSEQENKCLIWAIFDKNTVQPSRNSAAFHKPKPGCSYTFTDRSGVKFPQISSPSPTSLYAAKV